MGTYLRPGTNPPIVFISQLGTGGASWKPITERLPRATTFAYDRPGTGDAPPRLRDWWFFDDARLMVLTHDPEGRRIHTELITDEAELAKARALWDLAVHTTRGENE